MQSIKYKSKKTAYKITKHKKKLQNKTAQINLQLMQKAAATHDFHDFSQHTEPCALLARSLQN